MYVCAMNCVGSVYSNQKSVGSVTIGFDALAVAERNRTDMPTPMRAYLLVLLAESRCNFFFGKYAVF